MSPVFFPAMSLARRIHHRASRSQLVREALYYYIFTFAVIFLHLRFVGIKHYTPTYHREYLPPDSAAFQAMIWAFLGPVLWVLDEYVLQGTEWWRSYWGLDWQIQRLVLGGAVLIVFATVFAWRWMLPLWGLAAAVAFYLRFSRPKDSL